MCVISAMDDGKCSPGATCNSLFSVRVNVIGRQHLVASRRKTTERIHDRPPFVGVVVACLLPIVSGCLFGYGYQL